MFGFIKNKLQKIYSTVTSKFQTLFGHGPIDEATLKELETILIGADTGVKTTRKIMDNLRQAWQAGTIQEGTDLKAALEQQLLAQLEGHKAGYNNEVFLLVGINGSGKTTFAGKLTHQLTAQGKKI